MNTEHVMKIVNFIQDSKVINKEEHFSEKYSTFKKNYPVLFKVSCQDEKIDDNMLGLMLEKLSDIKTNNISQHEASVNVGKLLFEKYVEPIVSSSGI